MLSMNSLYKHHFRKTLTRPHELGAKVDTAIFEFDFFGNTHTILGDAGGAVGLIQNDVASLQRFAKCKIRGKQKNISRIIISTLLCHCISCLVTMDLGFRLLYEWL